MRTQKSLDAESTAYTHNPAVSTAAVITVAADEDHEWVIDEMDASYDDPTQGAGTLIVSAGGTVIWKRQFDAVNNVGQFTFKRGLSGGSKNEALVITLLAVTGATGSLNANIR